MASAPPSFTTTATAAAPSSDFPWKVVLGGAATAGAAYYLYSVFVSKSAAVKEVKSVGDVPAPSLSVPSPRVPPTAQPEPADAPPPCTPDAHATAVVDPFAKETRVNPCPCCLVHEDDREVGTGPGQRGGMCYGCGQMFCGACTPQLVQLTNKLFLK